MGQMALRGYQEEILELVRQAFREGHRSVLLYAPTGAGKTEMAIALKVATKNKGKRAAMVLDRIVLCEQTSARLTKYAIDHGVMQAGHWRNRPYEHIQVCSAQTLEKRGSMPGTNLLIIDECHTIRDQTVQFIKNHEDLYVVGLSASPFSDGLANIYSKVVSAVTTKQLVEMGNLTPLRVFVCKEVDMAGVKKVAGEWASDETGKEAMKITGDVVSKWVEKTTEIFGGPVKTIVFCTNVAHGADLAQKFGAAGYNFIPISYKDSDEFKQDVVKDFSRPDTTINGLIACDILTKGFDVADVMCGVSARPFSKSFSSHVQQMGRVMRTHPNDSRPVNVKPPLAPPPLTKPFALWLCHSGNYLRFQEDWDALYEDGVTELKDGKEKSKPELSPEEKEQRKCPKCGAIWVGRGDVCSTCGHVRPAHLNVETVEGEMEEVGESTAKEKVTRELKQGFYSQLLTIQRESGYADGWVAHKYKEKFGVWPRMLNDTLAPVTAEMRSWLKSRKIAWAKAQAKQR